MVRELGVAVRDRAAEAVTRDELLRARQHLSVTLASIGDGVITTDAAGLVDYLNPVAEALTGWSVSQARGLHLEEVFRIVNEHDRRPVDNPVREVLRLGQTVGLANHTVLIARDGTERAIDDSAAPIRQEDGRVSGVVLIFRDVTERRRLEAAHAQLAAIVKHSEDAMFSKTLDGVVQSWNAGATRLYGYTPEEMIGKPVSLLVPAEQREELHEIMEGLRRGEPTEHIETVRQRKDGARIHVSLVVSPLRSAEGELIGASAVARDITRRKEAERRLQENEERLRLALDAGRMGTWQWNVATGEVVWSAGLEAIHGLAPGAFAGTFEAFQSDMHPDDRERVLAAIRQSLEEGTDHQIDYRLVLPDGTVRWVEGRGKLIREKGRPVRMLGVCMDITERMRRAEGARLLADVSMELSNVVDYQATLKKIARLVVPRFADWCTVDVVTSDGKLERLAVAHVDPSKEEGAYALYHRYPPDPGAEVGAYHILRTGDAELVQRIDDQLLVSVARDEEHLRLVRALGLRSYIGVPLRGRRRILGVLGFVAAESGHRYDAEDLALARDLAHRAALAIESAELYRELQDRDRRKDEFLATLSHELRNPLAPIRHAVDIIRANPADMEQRARTLDLLERQVKLLVRLVDDLLEVSRITLGKLELRREPVAIAAVLESALETARPLIESAQQRLEIRLPEGPVPLDADLVRLGQVFSNLLTNASKYTGPGGTISLSCERDDNHVQVRVKDNGEGIAADVLPHIFDLFTQARTARDSGQGGLGIGLSLVRGLVELHGGDVRASSDGAGTGSEFVVRLPIAPAWSSEGRGGSERRSTEAARPAKNRKILVVDDNVDAATTLQMLLEMHGHSVRTANDGSEAIGIVSAFEPDLVLLDIGMPGLSGFEVAKILRARPGRQPVLAAVTGWSQEQDRRRTQEAGFAYHFAKPLNFEELHRLLESLGSRSD